MERRTFLKGAAAAALAAGLDVGLGSGGPAEAASTIKIGEINAYTALPAFTIPYRNGWKLALDEINRKGIDGHKLEVISRDSGGKPGDAVTAANELVTRDGVKMLMGTFFSNVGLAVSDFAKQKKIVFVAGEPLTDAISWSKGNRYTFRLRPPVYVQVKMLADWAAKLPAKRWATVAPNYEYGHSAVEDFKKFLSAKRPDVQWVAAQWPAVGKIDGGAVAEALLQAKPDAIFNVTFGADLTNFVRAGTTRGLFKGREVVSLLTGEPEYLDPLGADTPNGWIVTGYPWSQIKTPAHEAFLKAYEAKYHDYPRLGSVVGYVTMKSVAAMIKRAGSTDTDKLIKAGEGLKIPSPFGEITFRAVDHQSTMGAFIGKTAMKNGKGMMVDWHYASGAEYLPSVAEARKMRPAD